MDLVPILAIVLVAFAALAVADLYFDNLYQGVGRRVLLRLSSGRFPPADPSALQRLLTSAVGLSAVVAALSAALLVIKFMA